MRINTSGKKEWRTDLYERTAESLGEKTKTGAIDSACIHANQDIEAKRNLIKFLSKRLPPSELEKAADMLSTDEIKVEVDLQTSVEIPQ